MSGPLFLDSSVLIEYLRDRPGAADLAVPDAVIAATAKLRGATLLTFNPRHFEKLVRVREPYSRRPSGG